MYLFDFYIVERLRFDYDCGIGLKANGNSDDYVSLLGVLQACSDFTKPATIDEEKLLKSILSMDIELTDNEESVLKSLRKVRLACMHVLSSETEKKKKLGDFFWPF